MPLTLTLNTAEKRIQIMLSRGGEIAHLTDVPAPQCGAELLAPALADACREIGATIPAIARVACVAGPGSFTGLRLALTTAAGLARAGNVQQAGLNYLQCLAASVSPKHGQRLRVLVNARRGWLYWGEFASGALTEMALISLENAAGVWAKYPTPDFVLGSGLSNNREWFQQYYAASTLLGAEYDHPSSAALLAMTRTATWTNTDIEPLYLRDCDAVENLDHIARTQGQDPALAHAELRRLLTAELVTADAPHT